METLTRVAIQFIITILYIFLSSLGFAQADFATTTIDTVKGDYLNFYSLKRLQRMGLVFSGGAIIANTDIDEEIHEWYQDDVRSSFTDELSGFTNDFGSVNNTLPIVGAAIVLDYLLPESTLYSGIGSWGHRSLRAYLVGTPALLITQQLTGGSRPGERNNASHWRPFEDANGVSGHAFVGAVPFLTVAEMNDNNLPIKIFFYAASTLTAIARINNESHFFSQAMLGWYMAWESVDAVADSTRERARLMIAPIASDNLIGLFVAKRF